MVIDVLKDKLLYVVVVVIVVGAAYLSLQQVDGASLFPSQKQAVLNMDISEAPKEVVEVIEKLKAKYPHVKDACIYGSAMIMHDKGNDVAHMLEAEAKCIHTMVINETKESDAPLSMEPIDNKT